MSAKTNTQKNRQTDKHTNFETLLCSEKKRSSRQIFFIVKFSGVLSSRVKTRFVSKLISSASLHCRAHTGPKTGEHSWALVNNRETRTLEILNLSVGKYCHSHFDRLLVFSLLEKVAASCSNPILKISSEPNRKYVGWVHRVHT